MNNIPKTVELFDLFHSSARELLEASEYPFEALLSLRGFIKELSLGLSDEFTEAEEGVYISKEASVDGGAVIKGPAIISAGAEIRVGAYIRGSVIVGRGAVVGNSSEVKNSIIFDEGKLPHYNYAGDSIIGYRAHMGAGAIASNLRLDKRTVTVGTGGEKLDTGMKKLGVMLGDYAEVGCGAVMSPGTVIGREAAVYPLSHVRGIIPERSIFDGEIRRNF